MNITGNVQVDKRYLEGPRNVVLEKDTPLTKFCEWSQAAEGMTLQHWRTRMPSLRIMLHQCFLLLNMSRGDSLDSSTIQFHVNHTLSVVPKHVNKLFVAATEKLGMKTEHGAKQIQRVGFVATIGVSCRLLRMEVASPRSQKGSPAFSSQRPGLQEEWLPGHHADQSCWSAMS